MSTVYDVAAYLSTNPYWRPASLSAVQIADIPGPADDPIAIQRAMDVPDAVNVPTYRAYSAGNQPHCLTDEQKEALTGLWEEYPANDNICHQINAILADRVEWERFDVPKKRKAASDGAPATPPTPDALEEFLDDLRVKNHLDAMQADISYAVARDGNHYIAVDWKKDSRRNNASAGRPLWMHEPAWDGNTGMHLVYDERGIPAYAVKEWVGKEPKLPEHRGILGGIARFFDKVKATVNAAMVNVSGDSAVPDSGNPTNDPDYRWRTIYLPGEIRHYRLASGGTVWEEYRHKRRAGLFDLSIEEEPFPIPWTVNGLPGGEPLGIPVFHFANASRTGKPHGASELTGGVIGIQDQINDAQWDLTAAGRYTGFQTTWSAGVSGRDAAGNAVQLDTAPGRHHFFDDPNAKMGYIPPGDASQLISIIREKRDTACRMTQTPVHLVTVGSNTTGEAIVRAEAPLENKAKKVANKLAPAYSSAAHFSVILTNARGGGSKLDEETLVQAVMAPTSRLDTLSVAEQVGKVASFLDRQSVLELLGYPPARIAEIIANKQKEAAAALPAATETNPPDGQQGNDDEGDAA